MSLRSGDAVVIAPTKASETRGWRLAAADTPIQRLDGESLVGEAAMISREGGVHEVAISGWSRHLRALLLEGHGPPPSTSMLRNRAVPDLAAHLVAPAALTGPALVPTLERARSLAERNGMRHHLVISGEGLVVVSGAPPLEAMAHWHNIEMAARVECLRIEKAALGGMEE